MKTGKSLVELATELERQAASKKDFIAPTQRLKLKDDPTHGVVMEGVNGGMPLRPTAHAQLAATLQIPKAYYDRMLKDAPDLLAANANRWLEKEPQKKLIRTLDNGVRAILSDKFRPLDNLDLAQAILPTLGRLEANVISSEVTERRFYLKAVTKKVAGALALIVPGTHQRRNEPIQAGLVISNSEIGEGRLTVEALTYILRCTNGAIMEQVTKRAHLGGRVSGHEAIDEAREYFTDETRKQSDKTFFLQVRDTVSGVLTQERFDKHLLTMRRSMGEKLPEDVPAVVEVAARRYAMNEAEKGSVLKHLIEGGDLSSFGLANAITRASQDVESYDRATELEAAGGEVFQLPAKSWAS
jgi:hypothetical protein